MISRAKYLPWIILAVPALVLLWAVLQTNSLPDLDYWYALARLATPEGFSRNPAVWLAHSNEHFIPLSACIYAVNILLAGGSSTVLSLIAWGFGLLQALCLLRLLPASCTESLLRRCCSYLLVGLFVFTPAAYHNWLRGMSGVCWVGANGFAVLSLYAFERFRLSRAWPVLLLSMVAAIAASLSYSTGLMVWPMLCLYALTLLPAERRPVIVFAIAGGIMAVIIVLTFQRPPHHQPPSASEPLQNLRFFFSLLGGTLSALRPRTIAWGGVSFAVFLAAVVMIIRDRRVRDASALLVLSLYPLLNGVVSSIFRVTKYSAASASRYATLPSLFLLVTSLLAAYAIAARRPKAVVPVMIAGLLVALLPFWISYGEYREEFDRQEMKAAAALSLKLGGFDWDLLKGLVMRQRSEFEDFLPTVKALNHVPFNEAPGFCPAFGSQPEVKERIQDVTVLDAARTAGSGIRYVAGRIKTPLSRCAHCYMLMDSEGTVRGRVVRLTGGKRWAGYTQQDAYGPMALVEWPAARRLGVVLVPPRK